MSSASYDEMRLRLEEGRAEGTYRVVASALGVEVSRTFNLPFSDVELENFVLKLGRTRKGVRRIESPEMQLARSFGSRLFDAVFGGDVRDLYKQAEKGASEANRGLRITLALTDAPRLTQIPWEYLCDKSRFLSLSTWTPVVRYLDLARPPRPLQLAFPLRILGMVSSPSGFVPLDVAAEQTRVESALAALVREGVVAIDWVEDATLLSLTRQLRRADYHVFHYIGHGGFDVVENDGVLVFEDAQGRGQPVTGRQLGDILHDERTLRLAVLNACEGARSSVDDPFSGVATSLIEREIPAVIGMQFEITDAAAIVFAAEFYSVLADGQPVDAAVSEARKSIYALGNDIEWGTPVLFMRVANGKLFDLPTHIAIPRVDPGSLVQEVAGTAPIDAADEPGVTAGIGEPPEVTAETPPEVTTEAPPEVTTEAPPEVTTEAPPEVREEAEELARKNREAAAAEWERLQRVRAEAAERERQQRQEAEAAERVRRRDERAAAEERARQERLAGLAAEANRLAREREAKDAARQADTEAARARTRDAEERERRRRSEELKATEASAPRSAPRRDGPPTPGASAPDTRARGCAGIVALLLLLLLVLWAVARAAS